MTITIPTDRQARDSVPTLHVRTLKDLAPRDDDRILGGLRDGTSGGGGCVSDGAACA